MAPPPGPQEANPAQRRLRVLNQHLGAARLRAGPDEDQCTGAPSGLRTTEVHRSSCRHEGNCRHGCSCWHEGGATCSRSRQIVPAPTPLALAPAMGRKPAGTPASVKVAATSRSATSAARQPVVVGAMIMDIQARPSLRAGDIVPGTTVPGEVRHVHGGVGRNIAECMATVGCPPLLISVVGKDAAGEALLSRWTRLGLPTAGIRQLDNVATPMVCAVIGRSGEMAAGVAQVEAMEDHLTPEWLASLTAEIQSAPLLLLDANLATEVLSLASHVATQSQTPVWCDPVSVAKSTRLIPSLSRIHFMTPNRAELHAIAEAAQQPHGSDAVCVTVRCQCQCHSRGAKPEPQPAHCTARCKRRFHGRVTLLPTLPPGAVPIPKLEDVYRDALVLLRRGVQHVLVTLGERGALLVHRSCAATAARSQPTSPGFGSSGEVSSMRWEVRVQLERGEGEGAQDAACAISSGGACNLSPGGACTRCLGSPCCVDSLPCAPPVEAMAVTWFPALPLRAPGPGANTTGAGDCLIGAAAAAFCRGMGLERGLGVGMLAARLAVESESNVPEELSQIRDELGW